jgi:2-desacetyl-2-hydroxyethyl bacteriochlorophyllide A dehydrogenase
MHRLEAQTFILESASMPDVTYLLFPERDVVRVERESVSEDALAPNEALIRSETSIISAGTELARLRGLETGGQFPTRPGYGTIGRILDKGSALDGFAVGERVFFAGKHASVQRFRHGEGHQWAHLFKVPEALDPIAASVACMAQIAATAPTITELRLGDRVAVFGLGLVGILAAQLYRLRGARVLGVDPVASRCELAQRAGITETCQVPPPEQAEAVRSWSGGEGAHVVCDATGVSPAIASAIQCIAPFGQLVLLGSPRAAWQSNTTELLSAIHMRGLVVRGAHMWRFPVCAERNVATTVEWNFATIFEQIGSGALQVRELISHVIPPEQAPEAYAGLRDEPQRWTGVVIDWR